MAKLSHPPVAAETMAHFLEKLWLSLTFPKNEEEIRGFLQELLTPTEVKMLAKRLQIAQLLVEGKTYQEIKNSTRAQNSTIAQINNILNNVERSYLKKIAAKLNKLATAARRKAWSRNGKLMEKNSFKYAFGTLH